MSGRSVNAVATVFDLGWPSIGCPLSGSRSEAAERPAMDAAPWRASPCQSDLPQRGISTSKLHKRLPRLRPWRRSRWSISSL
jgi:hypothetical protein